MESSRGGLGPKFKAVKYLNVKKRYKKKEFVKHASFGTQKKEELVLLC